MSKQRIGVGRLAVASHETLRTDRAAEISETRSADDGEPRFVRRAHIARLPENPLKHYVM